MSTTIHQTKSYTYLPNTNKKIRVPRDEEPLFVIVCLLLFSTESEALECSYCAFLVSLLEVLSN